MITKVDFRAKTNIPPPVEEIEGHDLPTICFNVHKNYLVSGGSDGSLQIRSYKDFNNFSEIRSHGWRDINLSVVGCSNVDGIYYSCGKDGSFYVWNTN